MANSIVCQSKWKQVAEPLQAKSKTYRQAPTHWLKFYEEVFYKTQTYENICIKLLQNCSWNIYQRLNDKMRNN